MAVCTSNGRPKRKYPTKKDVMFGRRRHKLAFGEQLIPYFCHKCKNYHLGHEMLSVTLAREKKREEDMVGKLIGALRKLLDKEPV